MKSVSNLMLSFVALVLSSSISADTAPSASKTRGDAAKGREIATQVCAACHSPDGNSVIPMNPSLAGQHAEYITRQLESFKQQDDKPAIRQSPVMSVMVEPLSAEDMRNLGAYYAQQAARPAGVKDKSLALQGEKVYRGGNLESGLPACAGCHSPNGAGIPPHYPRLAGQHAEYVATQLRSFRASERAKDPNNEMHMIASRMSEIEIESVSEFISGLR
ncbi:cytochrome c [Nitrosovibrio sp. Nv17]|uniref:c-type cytochrome n=1 Tax=Nitrosovibrio sp. Nv17 TaxID=1855339 RepID=UPI000930ADB3|nr:c-type cytochrome [Nitrosovibrio sp. Nv17]